MARPPEIDGLAYGRIYEGTDGRHYKVARLGDDILVAGPEDTSPLQTGRDMRCPLCVDRTPHSEAVHVQQIGSHLRSAFGRRGASDEEEEDLAEHDPDEPDRAPRYATFGARHTHSLYGRADAGDGELDVDSDDDYSQLSPRERKTR